MPNAMHSAGHVADKIAELLVDELTRRLPLMRQAWGLDATLLPDAEHVQAGELAEGLATSNIAKTFVNVLTPREIPPMKRVDIDEVTGHPVWEIKYACRLQILHLGDDWPTAIQARDHLMAACRATLLEYPTLTTVPRLDTGFVVHPDTMSATYGTPSRTSGTGSQVWAGGMLSADVRSEETVAMGSSRPGGGRILAIDLLVEKIPVGAPMPDGDPRY